MENVDSLLITMVTKLSEPTLEEVAKATNLTVDDVMDIVHRLVVAKKLAIHRPISRPGAHALEPLRVRVAKA